MAGNDLKILITGTLNTGATIGEINSALSSIEGRINKLNVGINIDNKQLNDALKQITDIQSKLKTNNTTSIISEQDNKKIQDSLTTYDQAIAKAKELGSVKISNDSINPLTNDVEKFTLTITKATGEVDKLKFELASLNGIQIDGKQNQIYMPTKSSSVDNTQAQLERQLQQEQEINKTVDQRSQALQQQISLYQRQAELQATNLMNNPNKTLSTDQQTSLQNYLNSVKSLDTETPNVQNQMKNLSQDFREISSSATDAGMHTMSFSEQLKTAFSSFSIWMMAATGVMQVWQSLKDGISYVNQLNDALTQISIVTYQSQSQVAGLAQQYNQLGQQMGVSTTELANTAVDLYRQGITSASEVSSRMKTITEYAKISSLDTQQASEIMTAAINSMGVSAQRAADVWSYLGDATATGADEIGIAMQKVGGTAGSVGVSFEKVSSWIAVISSRTRESADTIGQSVKSILARMESMKQTGFSSDDNTSVNQVAKALASVNIQLMDSSGNFRNFGTIMDELGSKWGSLSNRQQAYIATTMAGTYQQSRFLNLMEGYNQVVQLNAGALDSAGTAEQKFQLYQQGTQAQLDRLKASWEALWMSAFNSTAIQSVIGGLTSVAHAVTSITNTFGDLPIVVGIAVTAFMLFNNKMKETIMLNGEVVIKSLQSFIPAFSNLENTMLASQAKFTIWGRGLTASMDMVKAGFSTLKAVGTSAFTFLAGAAIPLVVFTGISLVIQKLTDNYTKQQQAQKDLQTQENNLVTSYQNNKDKVSQLVSEYEALNNIRNTTGLSTEQNQQYVDVQNQLAKILPTVSNGEDAKGNSILKSSDAIKTQIGLLQQQIDLENKQTKYNAPLDIQNNVNSINKTSIWGDQTGGLQQQLDYSKKISDEYANDLKNAKEEKLSKSDIVYISAQYNLELEKQNSLQQQINTKLQSNSNAIKTFFSGSKINTDALTQISFALTSVDLKGKDPGNIKDTFNSIADSVNKLNSALQSNNQQGIKDAEDKLQGLGVKGQALQTIITSLIGAQNQNGTAAKNDTQVMQQQILTVDQLNKELSDAKGNFEATKNAILDMIKSQQLGMAISATQGQLYSDMANKLNNVNQLLENLANGQNLSASAAMTLIQQVPELTKYISIQNGQVQINTKGIIDWRDAQVASYKDVINAEKAQVDAQASALKAKLANYGVEVKALLTVAQANQALADAEKQHAKNANDIANTNNNGSTNLASRAKTQQQLKSETSTYNDLTSGINGVKDALSQLDKLSSMGSEGLDQVGTSMDKTTSSTQQSTYVVDKYKNSIDALDASLNNLKQIQQDYPNYSKQYRDALQQEISLLQQEKTLTDAQAKSLASQIASGNIAQTGMVTSSSSSSGGSAVTGSYSGQYSSYINQAASKYGVDPNLIAAIIQNESNFNQGAISSAGAIGLMQLMPSTAKGLGVNPNDAYQNIMGGTKYISQLISQFGGDLTKAIESYNAGAGNIQKGIIPAQTQEYVKNVLASYNSYSGGRAPSSGTSGSTAAQQAQAVDQAKSQLLQLQQQSQQYVSQIQQAYLDIINSNVAVYDHMKSIVDGDLAKLDYEQNVVGQYSATWNKLQVQRESDYQKEIGYEQQSINYLNQQIKYNNQLTAAQKATLSDQVLQRQQDILSLEQKIYDERSQMADAAVNAYKQALSTMKDAATKTIDNEITALNNQISQTNYKNQLADAQKSAQDIQDQINQLMLDTSTAGKKKLADLTQQLSDQQKSILQMQTDNSNQQQLDNLNNQKQTVSDYYDNMINDETKFAQMRQNIISMNTTQIYNDLQKFSKNIQANVKVLGTGVVNTVLAMISGINGYIGNKFIKPIKPVSLDTGGYTGNVSSDGALALLHQKEIVLNQSDTSNFLKAVNVTRDLFNNLVNLPDLSNLFTSPTLSANGNTYLVNFNIDKMTGSQSDMNTFATKFMNFIKSKGG